MTFAVLIAALVLAGALLFMGLSLSILRPRPGTLDWVALQERRGVTFAVKRHPMVKKDILPVVLITVVYTFSAFFQLGSPVAPQESFDFSSGETYTLAISGQAIRPAAIRLYGALGTGGYNLEISRDGQRWSTLWSRTEKDQWDRDQTIYYWAQAQGWTPSYALTQDNDEVLKWRDVPLENPLDVRYLRITGHAKKAPLQLCKLVFLGEDGLAIPFEWTMADGSAPPEGLAQVLRLDPTVPNEISWRNSAYFDEIYHPRTALEHIQGVYPYEITHPPLGKLIIGLGIRAFGMTPFGWRFMGTLFGALMVPLFYCFLKNIFGKTNLATCGTILLSAEFMHLTQTRIATIDTYGVFFILLSYFFFYRWLTAPATPNKKGKTSQGYLPLALSGVAWGVGCACKWTVIYAGAGLAALYVIHMVLRIRTWDRSEGAPKLAPWLWKTLALSVVFFVLVPLGIYTASYIPYAQAGGMTDYSLSNTLSGFRDNVPILWRNLVGWRTAPDPARFQSIPFHKDSLSGIMLDNQWYMLHYHSNVHSAHPYSARWYQWLVDARPILYYSQDLPGGLVEKFAAFNNPLVSWAGLLAILSCAARCFRRMWAKLALLWTTGLGCALTCWLVGRVKNGDFDPTLSPEALRDRFLLMAACLVVYLVLSALIAWQNQERSSGLDVFITLGFAAQFLPWVAVGRITYPYHYFPSTLFLILALCCAFRDLMECPRVKWRGPVYGFTAAAVGLYVLFYPVLTGLAVPAWYAHLLRFLPSWPL